MRTQPLQISFGLPASSGGARSFAFQYMSVILIVLCVVVGMVSRSRIKSGAPAVQAAPIMRIRREEPAPVRLGELKFPNFYSNDPLQGNLADLEGVMQALQSHDLNARIDVYHNGDQAPELWLAAARTRALSQALAARHVPPSALQIVARFSRGEQGLRLELQREGERAG